MQDLSKLVDLEFISTISQPFLGPIINSITNTNEIVSVSSKKNEFNSLEKFNLVSIQSGIMLIVLLYGLLRFLQINVFLINEDQNQKLTERKSEIYPPELMLRPSLMQEKWFSPTKGHIEIQVGCLLILFYQTLHIGD